MESKQHLAINRYEMLPRVAIKSDFIDFYDHAFSPRHSADFVWERNSRNDMSKREQFEFLDQLGFKTPEHGTVAEVHKKLRFRFPGFDDSMFELFANTVEVVIYLDEYAHRGEGKTLTTLADGFREHPHLYCSRYIRGDFPFPDAPYATSYRRLQVGSRSYFLKYTGYGSWMSNHAPEVEVEVLIELGEDSDGSLTSRVPYPVFAIDFVRQGSWLYAIDFNTAPGMSGLDLGLKPEDIYHLVAKWYVGRK